LAQKMEQLARAFLWEDSYKRLKLTQLLGQLGVFLTCAAVVALKHPRSWVTVQAIADG
jgi:hypothetical protein